MGQYRTKCLLLASPAIAEFLADLPFCIHGIGWIEHNQFYPMRLFHLLGSDCQEGMMLQRIRKPALKIECGTVETGQ